MFKYISSSKNSLIKDIQALDKSSVRKKQGLFLVEGFKEISLALEAGYTFKYVLYNKEPEKGKLFLAEEVFVLESSVFNTLVYRKDIDNALAVVYMKNDTISAFKKNIKKPLVLIIENVEKPGNLGAILRTADAAGVDLVLCCNQQTDLYNPNVVRSSVGCVFTNTIISCTNEEALAWCMEKKIPIYTSYLESAENYHLVDYSNGCALVMGTEATGVSAFWIQHATQYVKIPMLGKIDSMNVSNAAAILVYEARKQLGF